MKKKKEKKEKLPVDLGTPETREKLRPDPLAIQTDIWKRSVGSEDAIELQQSASEVRRLFNLTTAGLTPRAVDLSSVRGLSNDAPEWLAIRKVDIYNPWATRQREKLPVIFRWLIDEESFKSIDASKGWRKGKASEMVLDALYDYAYASGRLKRRY